MDVKQMVLEELGDFGLGNDEAESAVAADELEELHLSEEELDEFRPAGEIEEEVEEEEVEEDSEGESRQEGRPEPGYSIRTNEEGRLTDEQMDANIEAAAKAFDDPHITKPAYVWGLKYMNDMFEQERAQWKAELANVDHAEARRMLAEQEAEEEAQENAEKERYLQG